MTDHTTAERAKFEAAYRAKFETAAALQPGIFEIDEFGDYLLAKVFVAFEMWKIGRATLPMAPPTTLDALMISQVFAQFREDACLPGDDRISESFIKAAGALMGERVVPVAVSNPHKGGTVAYLATEHYNEGWNACLEAIKIAAQSEPATRAVLVATDHHEVDHGTHTELVPHYDVPAPMGWISIRDHLPKFPMTVLVAYQSDADGEPCLDTGEAFLYPDGKWYGTGVFYSMGKDPRYEARVTEKKVAYWKPLPPAPTPDAERHVANHAGDSAKKLYDALKWLRQAYRGSCWISDKSILYVVDGALTSFEKTLAAPAQPTDKENGK